jgi:YidC/Oxa1 family membrane protein insertase
MLNALYSIIIFPIVQIIEIVYVLVYKLFDSPPLSVLGVSFAVTFLCLPLYIIAEKWQETERNTVKSLKPKADKIKAVFKGDEQYMILSAYYRQNKYHPIYALRSSFGILIQIPFFIAAYHYLSHLESIRGVSFLFIRDLSLPDAILTVHGFKINILPIAMTLINCVSGAVYTRGFSYRDKIQVYGFAVVFLALLYNSPSGLVLYWTMNNVFSLLKNIFYKLKNPLLILYLMVSVCVLGFILYLLFVNTGALKKRLLMTGAVSLVLFTPLFIKGIHYVRKTFLSPLLDGSRQRTFIFILSVVILTLITGFYIPTMIISSSPEEFSFIDHYTSPLYFIFQAFLRSLGLCAFWPLCIYFLFSNNIKTLLTALFVFISSCALANCVIFQGNYGVISNVFHFNTTSVLSVKIGAIALNMAVLLGIIAAVLFIIKINKLKIITSLMGILVLALTAFSAYNTARIHAGYIRLAERQKNEKIAIHAVKPVFNLSKDRKNIIVVMADCAINGFVRPIFDAQPRVKEQFDGFTLYPNTVSFALHTLMGVPPIWGGYEYTPLEMNKRSSDPLVEKHNEALMVLPKLLTGSGYQVTITDPSWANYAWVPDTGIYESYSNITAFNMDGHYNSLWYAQNNYGSGEVTSATIKRNILWFSLLKIMPPYFRSLIYDDGWYWGTDDIGNSPTDFINSYAVLDFLPELTSYDAEYPSALLVTSNATHEPIYLQYPDYIPAENVTDRGTGRYADDKYYHINNAFYLKFGEWLDALKKNGVYDNTRIIIVSDHGAGVDAHLADRGIPISGESREKYNPLLLVKDFNDHGELKMDMSFMTNADVPLLAVKDIIDNPVNPFTHKAMTGEAKQSGVYITINHIPMAYQHPKNMFKIRNDQWILVHDTIFDENNWSKVEVNP